ncbi:hypothetical protein EDB85DRAFT_1893412 [Lactarius pseudohatsudake]|nr:hypothetical protein EDB85DRAFT_1893412 [Lactarius pseudohatsudake]
MRTKSQTSTRPHLRGHCQGLKATEKPDPAPAVPKKKSKKSGTDEDKEIDESQVGVGLITTGGRYDNLVGMFTAAASSNSKKGVGLPCIGVTGRNKEGACSAQAGQEGRKKREHFLLKMPKGMHNYGAGEIFCRDYVECIIKECFVLYGGAQLNMPVFEWKDILAGKYGEDA